MIGKIIAAVAGAKMARGGGEGGMKGALTGAIVAGLARRSVPLAVLAVGGMAAKRMLDKRRSTSVDRTGIAPLPR